jgi:hypothetical protein
MTDEIMPKEEVVVETPNEPISEPETVISPESQTAQIPVSEPLPTPTTEVEPIIETIQEETNIVEPEIKPEPIPESIPEIVTEEIKTEISEPIKLESKPVEQIPEIKPEPVSESKPEPEKPKPIPEVIPAVTIISKSKSLARELLVKARNMIQFRKRKKLDKVMTLFLKKSKITNDEVEKFMHVSDATATRYLSQLEKENKIKQSGKTGKSVFYSKI